jgi:hypothetical protein
MSRWLNTFYIVGYRSCTGSKQNLNLNRATSHLLLWIWSRTICLTHKDKENLFLKSECFERRSEVKKTHKCVITRISQSVTLRKTKSADCYFYGIKRYRVMDYR